MAGGFAQRDDAGAGFYGLRNTAWAGHIRLQSAAGGWNIIVSHWGASACVAARRRHRVCKTARLFLPETLIAMAISSVLLLGSARFLPALQWGALRQTRQQSLENELWQRIYTVAKHLQRAGYCRGRCYGQALYIAEGGDCLLVSWDSNSDGVWNSAPSSESDTTGFRLRDGALKPCAAQAPAAAKAGRK